ncbi:MAG: GHKL domain-containing protein [Phycisphaerae bacterium]|nr:GHKL domain-containing protein [Phycisphaerae bacterium]
MNNCADKTGNGGSDQLGDGLCHRFVAQSIIESIPIGIVAFNSHLMITECNKQAINLLTTYNSADTIAEIIRTSFRKHPVTNWEDQILRAIHKESSTAFEDITFQGNGSKKTIRIICSPLVVKGQSPTEVGGTLLIEDVTAEVLIHEGLASAERLASVGKLSAKVAHELNNPLDGILRYINLAIRVMENAGGSRPAIQYLNESRKGLLRMVKIISELLEFSRSSYSAFKEADINKIAEDAVKAMENQANDNQVQIIKKYQKGLPNIRSGNLFQVFTNLIKNAIDAMEGQGGVLEVETHLTASELIINFSDEGIGLSQEVQENLFEPFFSTKEAGKGTGLGLAICKEIIEKYNGRIVAQNRQGKGSLFSVCIPLDHTSWEFGGGDGKC